MSPLDRDLRLKPSLLSRLTDTAPEGEPFARGYDFEDMAAAVQVDMENLLNTPRPYPEVSPAFPEVVNSIVNYGMREVVSRSASTPEQQEEIARELQTVIARFEPRLRDVRAEVLAAESGPTNVRVRVSATLCVEPAPAVAFDTILEMTTGRCSVTTSQG